MAEANVEALQRGYEALNRGDLSVVVELSRLSRAQARRDPVLHPQPGLVGNALFGAWWLDPLVALFIAYVAVKEGREAWRGHACGR